MPRRQPVDSYYSLELNERKVNENDTLSSNSTTSMPLLSLPPPSEASSGISAEEANQEGSFGGDDDDGGGDTDAATASTSASHPQDAFVEVGRPCTIAGSGPVLHHGQHVVWHMCRQQR